MDNYLLETRSFARRAAIISVVKTKFWRKNQKKVFPQFFCRASFSDYRYFTLFDTSFWCFWRENFFRRWDSNSGWLQCKMPLKRRLRLQLSGNFSRNCEHSLYVEIPTPAVIISAANKFLDNNFSAICYECGCQIYWWYESYEKRNIFVFHFLPRRRWRRRCWWYKKQAIDLREREIDIIATYSLFKILRMFC